MQALLQSAVREMTRRPERAQETLAGLILAELQGREGWSARFAQTQDQPGKQGALAYDPSIRPEK